ncbi:MAG TPA: hypothetical protein VFY71_06250 [Planctomycetota bacterium]|nr:hypothetical protein [Planctomycetota bacterium]
MDGQAACPKCSGAMQPGFVVDHGHYNLRTFGEWAVGQPIKRGWGGLKMPASKRFQMRGVRCEKCGFVELYANKPPGLL